MIGAIFAAVHHAEVVAARTGEPYGSLILAVAVTVIEVGLIVMLMTGGGPRASTYARDTVFSAVMITLNGIVGLSLLAGALRHRTVSFNASGSGSALATVITLAGLCLVLPSVTISEPGLAYSVPQLAFAAVASLVLYIAFVLTQTGQHRDFFVPVAADRHGRITGVVDDGVATEMAVAAADTIKRVLPPPVSAPDWSADPGLGRISAFVETPPVWHPQGV